MKGPDRSEKRKEHKPNEKEQRIAVRSGSKKAMTPKIKTRVGGGDSRRPCDTGKGVGGGGVRYNYAGGIVTTQL